MSIRLMRRDINPACNRKVHKEVEGKCKDEEY